MAKRILVTGGAGFLGSHLCERLLAMGNDVLCVDNYFTGTKQNLAHVLDDPRFELMRHDVTFPLYVEVDEIYNLACPASPIHYQHDPVQTTKTSVHGAINMLGLAKRVKAKILQASTSEVYGKSTQVPFREEADLVLGPTTKGRWSYAASKALDEFLALAYWRERKVPVIVVRLFNTVGPRQTGRYGMVLPNFVKQALDHAPITVYGSGTQSRCFCDVRDTVEALMRLMDTDRSIGEVVNIGNTEEISISELAQTVKARTQSKSDITYVPYDQAYEPGFEDMMRRVPNVEKLQGLTGFRPQTKLADIIDRVTNYQRERQAAERPRAVSSSPV